MGCSRAGTALDRRRDPRLSPPGKVWIASDHPSRTVQGRLADVSAGGVRVHWDVPVEWSPGLVVDVTIRLEDPLQPGPIQLVGSGVLLRVEDRAGSREAAVRFRAPLALRDHFGHIRLF